MAYGTPRGPVRSASLRDKSETNVGDGVEEGSSQENNGYPKVAAAALPQPSGSISLRVRRSHNSPCMQAGSAATSAETLFLLLVSRHVASILVAFRVPGCHSVRRGDRPLTHWPRVCASISPSPRPRHQPGPVLHATWTMRASTTVLEASRRLLPWARPFPIHCAPSPCRWFEDTHTRRDLTGGWICALDMRGAGGANKEMRDSAEAGSILCGAR